RAAERDRRRRARALAVPVPLKRGPATHSATAARGPPGVVLQNFDVRTPPRRTGGSGSLDDCDSRRPYGDGVVGVPVTGSLYFDLLPDERNQFGVVVFGIVADKPEQAVAIGQHAERFALLCAIYRAPDVSSPCAFGHSLFAIARNFDDLALERHFLAGGEQRRPGEKQHGDQTSRVP